MTQYKDKVIARKLQLEEEAKDNAIYGDYLEEDDMGCEMGSQVVCDVEEEEE